MYNFTHMQMYEFSFLWKGCAFLIIIIIVADIQKTQLRILWCIKNKQNDTLKVIYNSSFWSKVTEQRSYIFSL